MTRDEINALNAEKIRKSVRNKQLAMAIGCSESLISHFFNHRCSLSDTKQEKLKELIHQAKEYEWRKVFL